MLFTCDRPGTVAMASATVAAAGADGAAFGGTADGFLESEKAHLRWVRGVGCMAGKGWLHGRRGAWYLTLSQGRRTYSGRGGCMAGRGAWH